MSSNTYFWAFLWSHNCVSMYEMCTYHYVFQSIIRATVVNVSNYTLILAKKLHFWPKSATSKYLTYSHFLSKSKKFFWSFCYKFVLNIQFWNQKYPSHPLMSGFIKDISVVSNTKIHNLSNFSTKSFSSFNARNMIPKF